MKGVFNGPQRAARDLKKVAGKRASAWSRLSSLQDIQPVRHYSQNERTFDLRFIREVHCTKEAAYMNLHETPMIYPNCTILFGLTVN